MVEFTVSVPVMVTVYVPFAAVGVLVVGGGEVELPPPPPQPDTVTAMTTRMQIAATTANLRERRMVKQSRSSPAIAMLTCIA